jgi:hypothetical protein
MGWSGRGGGRWAERPTVRSPPAGVMVEVAVLGF